MNKTCNHWDKKGHLKYFAKIQKYFLKRCSEEEFYCILYEVENK